VMAGSKDWLAQAYLGGTGRRKAIDRDWFQIVAVIAKGTLQEWYDRPESVSKEPDTCIISRVKTIVIRRP
jgi:hypothetical protein